MSASDARLGAQLWIEREDPPSRVEDLVRSAAEIGLGHLRIFLMWPWIEEQQGEWNFAPFDAVFTCAERYGVRLKATLTANSGPWWLGTPSVLHSHTGLLSEEWKPAVVRYIETCVTRYAEHPAIGQWILWNEPVSPFSPPGRPVYRAQRARQRWAELLRDRYGDVAQLNRRWRTGIKDFGDAPFPEELPHSAHETNPWQSFAPWIDESSLRAVMLEEDLQLVAQTVRAIDADTPLCINPPGLFANHAASGYRLVELANDVETLGASFHAPWHFGFAPRAQHRILPVVGLSLLKSTPGRHTCEVTEVQIGNTYYAGASPVGVSAGDVAVAYLAPLLAGASSVTGWCMNTRHQDFEAGEWSLLGDGDDETDRSRAVTRVTDVLERLDEAIGPWRPAAPQAAVVVSEKSQAVALAFTAVSPGPSTPSADTAIHGSVLMTSALERAGVHAALTPLAGLSPGPRLIVVGDMISWDDGTAEVLLDAAAGGATVLIDGTSGRFDGDARLMSPWPAHFASRVGLRARGLQTHPSGLGSGDVLLNGHLLGRLIGMLSDVVIESEQWSCDPALTFRHESRPLVWSRRWGQGRLQYCVAPIARSAAELPDAQPVVAYLLERAAIGVERGTRPLSANTVVVRVEGEKGRAIGVFGVDSSSRCGEPIALMVSAGSYEDLWTCERLEVGAAGSLVLDSADGIAVLVRRY